MKTNQTAEAFSKKGYPKEVKQISKQRLGMLQKGTKSISRNL